MEKRLLDLIEANPGEIRALVSCEPREFSGRTAYSFRFRGKYISVDSAGYAYRWDDDDGYVELPGTAGKASTEDRVGFFDYLHQSYLLKQRDREARESENLYWSLKDNRRNPAKIVLYATVLGVAIVAAILVVLNIVS